VSVGISALLGDIIDFIIVAMILLITSFIGFYEKKKLVILSIGLI